MRQRQPKCNAMQRNSIHGFRIDAYLFFTLPHFNSARIISALLCTIVRVADKKLKEASTHKIAMTNAGNAFVPRDLDL